MARRDFQQSIEINVAPEQVYPFFSSYDRHTTLHPLIVAIRPIAPRPAAPTARWYRITDRIQLGPLRYSFTYTAHLTAAGAGTLVSEALQFPRVHLRNTTRCLHAGAGTRVEEAISITAPRPLIGYVCAQAEQAHRQLLLRLKQHLEGASA